MPDAYLLIGEITKPQGIRGELKARPVTCDPNRFYDLDRVYLLEGNRYVARNVNVRSAGPDAVYFRMDGVETRDDAEKMRGTKLYIDREHAVELNEDENFIVDLIGCECLDTDGHDHGKLIDVLQPGGNDVYIVHSAAGEILIPALKSVVLHVDIAEKRILLDAKRLREVSVFPDSEEIR